MPDTLGSTKAKGRQSRSSERILVFKWRGKWRVWCDGCNQLAKCRAEGCIEEWPSHAIAMIVVNEHLKVWHT